MTIPKVFHRVFLDDPIPERYEAWWRRFQEFHPDWQFKTWDRRRELTWLRNTKVFDQQTTHAGRSDVVRYEVVATFGGVYVDTDVEPLGAFDDLMDDDRPFAGWESDRLLCPTVIGGPAGHPALEALVHRLPEWAARYRKRPPNQQTGPHFLTAMWKGRTDVRLLPPVAFYPVGWWERARLNGDYPEASYAVHHWDQRWDPEAKARIDARQEHR